ncbi:unnamed protein product, partial [Effrenium voratum]
SGPRRRAWRAGAGAWPPGPWRRWCCWPGWVARGPGEGSRASARWAAACQTPKPAPCNRGCSRR